jgi:lysophospholipase L1-like esterase
MIDLFKQYNAKPILMTQVAMPPLRDDELYKIYRDRMIKVAKDNKVILVDTVKLFDELTNVRAYFIGSDKGDLFHPNKEGYYIQAKAVADELTALLKDGSRAVR